MTPSSPGDFDHTCETLWRTAGSLERGVESRLPVIITVLSVSALTFALPHVLAPYPKWLTITILGVILAITKWTHLRGQHFWNDFWGVMGSAVTTLFLLWSVGRLVFSLPQHRESPQGLLLSAGILWITNVVVFALWYWRIDAGGPNARDRRKSHERGAFLFPQMTLDDEDAKTQKLEYWSPQFVDYLFLAFNTSTALSPADTAVLSRWAKLLMMAQSAISLVIIALVAARAINTLN